ncbi:hypothetical protein [Nonomuraea diastatica]|uniref:Uncharacterized protein n=1 Tax=Nonomuraea diastatica TaxID=1848329 RepID=A0A4R4WJE3_9ACTN|nr:hypothetical protein [Nonomuraea diastatica]TDD16523.1 hypothetical protein E1294_31170 [Nonomuraea diastatica]
MERVSAACEAARRSSTARSGEAFTLLEQTQKEVSQLQGALTLAAGESTRAAAREALAEFEARQAAADAADRAAAADVTRQRQQEHNGAQRRERDAYAAQAREASEGSQAEASMDVFNAMAEIRMAASRALALLSKQQITFTTDRAEAIAELCDGAEAAIAAVRDMATDAALDDAALAAFMDENGEFL